MKRRFFDLGTFGEFWAGQVYEMNRDENSYLVRMPGILYKKCNNSLRFEQIFRNGLKFSRANEYGPKWYKARAELFVKVPIGKDPLVMSNWICFEIKPPSGGE